MIDNMTTCRRCGSDVCYEVNHDTSMYWQCMDCGFYTNTFMLKGSEVVNNLKETLPELYKDLLFHDEDGFIWCVKVIMKPGIGSIFAEGTSIVDWHWTFLPDIPILPTEQHLFPIKSGIPRTHKSDEANKKKYGQYDFILALQDAGLLLNQLI